MAMYWRVVVIDDSRFCIVGTMDLTFSECRDLSARRIEDNRQCVRCALNRLVAVGIPLCAPLDARPIQCTALPTERFLVPRADIAKPHVGRRRHKNLEINFAFRIAQFRKYRVLGGGVHIAKNQLVGDVVRHDLRPYPVSYSAVANSSAGLIF